MKLELFIRKIKDNLHKGEYYLEKYIINSLGFYAETAAR